MKPLVLSLALALSTVTAADAACTVEYKAKRSNPTKYDHGRMVIQDSACSKAAARPVVAQRLSTQGWTLLSIVSVKKSG